MAILKADIEIGSYTVFRGLRTMNRNGEIVQGRFKFDHLGYGLTVVVNLLTGTTWPLSSVECLEAPE